MLRGKCLKVKVLEHHFVDAKTIPVFALRGYCRARDYLKTTARWAASAHFLQQVVFEVCDGDALL